MGRNSVHWLRIEAALAGERHDAIPVSLWKHYHLLDRAPGQLARRTDEFHRQFGFDLAKLTPSGLYGVQDWGVGIQFGRHDDEAPTVIASPVGLAADWKSLPALEPETGALGRELEMCSRVRELWGDGVPYMMTIFSPITLAHKIAGDRVYEHMRHDPALLHAACAPSATLWCGTYGPAIPWVCRDTFWRHSRRAATFCRPRSIGSSDLPTMPTLRPNWGTVPSACCTYAVQTSCWMRPLSLM